MTHTTAANVTGCIDHTGRRFGRLTITDMLSDNCVRVSCDCGTTKEVTTANLIHNPRPIRSCGCGLQQLYANGGGRKSHGWSQTALYRRWATMIQRCSNPRAVNWKEYGGRGITVCDRWRNSFANFLADMGEPSDPKLTLERLDNDLGYFPGNVVWATRKEQIANRRTSSKVKIGRDGNETIH